MRSLIVIFPGVLASVVTFTPLIVLGCNPDYSKNLQAQVLYGYYTSPPFHLMLQNIVNHLSFNGIEHLQHFHECVCFLFWGFFFGFFFFISIFQWLKRANY